MHNSASANVAQSKSTGTAKGNYWTLYQAHQALPASISTLVGKNVCWNLAISGTYQLVCGILLGYYTSRTRGWSIAALFQQITDRDFGRGSEARISSASLMFLFDIRFEPRKTTIRGKGDQRKGCYEVCAKGVRTARDRLEQYQQKTQREKNQ